MSLKRIAVAAACMTVLSFAGAQAATHPHRAMHHGHRGPVAAGADLAAGAVDTGAAIAAGAIGTAAAIATAPFGGPYASVNGGYYAPSPWGDFDCQPGFAGCRPYAAKDWSRP